MENIKVFLVSADRNLPIGILLVRVFTGIIILKYGLDIFDNEQMQGYSQWLSESNFPKPNAMVYFGKIVELLGGSLLILGLLVRPVALALVFVMLVVIFFMGRGRIFNDEQLPFLLMLLFFVFFFIGGGRWSLDNILFK